MEEPRGSRLNSDQRTLVLLSASVFGLSVARIRSVLWACTSSTVRTKEQRQLVHWPLLVLFFRNRNQMGAGLSEVSVRRTDRSPTSVNISELSQHQTLY